MFIVSNAADLLSFRICTSMLLLQWDTIYIYIRKLLSNTVLLFFYDFQMGVAYTRYSFLPQKNSAAYYN